MPPAKSGEVAGRARPPSVAEVTPAAGQIQWHRTLAGKRMKGAMAMDQKELVHAVAERTMLSREESADITRAVLVGLADQLSEGEARRLATDVPDLVPEQPPGPRRRTKRAQPVMVTDFIRQVSERTGLTYDDARAGTAAVLAALREKLSQEDYRHVVGQLPAGYSELVTAGG